jgi:hypothetical protein
MLMKENMLRTLVVFGISTGIALLFVGGIVSSVFPAAPTDLLSYRVSASIKLLGVGGLVCAMIVGGLRLDGMDRTLRLLLLILGLVMLVIYTAGSSMLEWNVSSYMHGNTTAFDSRPTGMGIPGFESWVFLGALGIVVIALMVRRHRRAFQ